MKIIKSEEDLLEFDNGLKITGVGDTDCCAHNFMDFEQFEVGNEFPDMTVGEFIDKVTIKEDGFAMKDTSGLPKWAQARSYQNGYYSAGTTLYASQGDTEIMVKQLIGEESE